MLLCVKGEKIIPPFPHKDERRNRMDDKKLTELGGEIVKRGRPKGTGGNERKDLSWSGNKELQPGDNSKFLRHALASWDLPPIDISDASQVAQRIEWFFSHCAEDDMKPTVTGLCNALGIDRSTFYRWGTGEFRKGETSDHYTLVKKARNILEELWEDYMLNGKINPVTGIFLGKNHFGYADKQEVVLTPNSPLGDTKDTKELEERYIESVVDD
jgi:hypothetical protein